MARGKNKHTERHLEDPILAAALAKPNLTCRHVEIDRRSIAVMFNNEVSKEAESEPEVPKDKNASIEQISEGVTSGGHGPEGVPTERHLEDVSTLGIR